MGWERRKRGGWYYTRTRRQNGKIIREYVGTGEIAAIAARLDEMDRQCRLAQIEAERERQRHLDDSDRRVSELCKMSEAMLSGLLVASGYRQHRRGEWRHRREEE